MNPPEPSPSYEPMQPRHQPVARGDVAAAAHGLPDEEVTLVRRMAAGDERALGELYDRRARVVHALVLQLVGDPDDAEDVVEEVFWQAWRQASRHEASRGSVGAWLLTIARSRALDRLRARRRRREEPMPDGVPEDGGGFDAATAVPGDPGAGAEAADRRTIVLAALGELPAEQRETMRLAYYEGLSQTEIAERMGQPLGTVKTRMRLALGKLRDRLAGFAGGAL